MKKNEMSLRGSKTRSNLVWGIASLTLAMTVSALLSCGPKNGINRQQREVIITKPVVRTISQTVMATGSVEAEDFADIYPRAPGKVIKKLLKEGDPVKKDQPIMLTLQDEVGYTFKPSPVVSKIDGYVGRIRVDVGGTVNPSTPVVTVVKPDNMRIKIDLPEKYLPDIHEGLKIDFSTDTLPKEKFSGAITSISSAVDLANRTSRVEVTVPNPDHKLVHGMFARLDIPVETHENVVSLPLSAVSWEADKQYVYKVENGKITHAPIKIGIRNSTFVEVLEGVSSGDLIANGKLIDLIEGEPVTIKEEDTDIKEKAQ